MKSIKTKLMVSFSLLIFAVIMVMGIVFIKTGYSSLQRDAEKSLKLMAAEGAKLTKSRMDTLFASLEIIAQKKEIEDMGWDVDLKVLKEELKKTSFLDIGYVLPNGYANYSDGTMRLMSDKNYIKDGLQGKNAISDVVISRVTRRPEIEICVPVKRDGKPVGAIIARSEADTLSEMTKDEGYGDGGYAFMLNKDGRVIAYPDTSKVTKLFNPIKEVDNNSSLSSMARAFQYMIDHKSGVTSFSRDKDDYFTGFAPIDGTDWIFATTAAKEEVFSVIPKMIQVMIIIMILVIIIGTFVVLLLEQMITKPLTGITNLSKQYANLDFRDIISDTYLKQKDEVGVLSQTFQTLTLHLREIILSINESAKHVSSAAKELIAASEQSVKISEEIFCTVENIARGANDQAEITEFGSVNATHLGSMIEKNREFVQHLNLTSKKVNELVDSGLSDVELLSRSASENKEATEEICDIIIQTKNSSRQIGEASKMISEMANQTTLLALNASIEAARAGEAGRGFSIVAKEIQKMADQSTVSTKYIDEIINTLLGNIKKSTISMERIRKTSEQQQKSVIATISKYKAIADSMEVSEEALRQLNASERDMEEAKNQIVEMLISLSAIAQQNAAGTQEATSVSEKQTAVAKTLAVTSSQLSKLSFSLQSIIERFHV